MEAETAILRKKTKINAGIKKKKNTVTKFKNAFSGIISILGIV